MPTRIIAGAHRAIATLLVPCIMTLAACGGGGTDGGGGTGIVNPPPSGGPVTSTSVSMSGSAFAPRNILVSPGATLTFTNNDGYDHNVAFTTGSVTPIDAFSSGSRTTVAPSVAGTYDYRCTIHAGMNGTVQVQ